MLDFLRGFIFAAKGIWLAIKQERNLRVHLVAAVFVYLLSLFYNFNKIEYCVITLVVVGVIALEVVNSAIERIVNKLWPQPHTMAGAIKDMAAGAVLVFCMGAAVCGFVLFWNPAGFANIAAVFRAAPWLFLPLLFLLAASAWFVFGLNNSKKKK